MLGNDPGDEGIKRSTRSSVVLYAVLSTTASLATEDGEISAIFIIMAASRFTPRLSLRTTMGGVGMCGGLPSGVYALFLAIQ